MGETARSPRTEALKPRVQEADKAVPSICPYCAVGCAQLVYVKDGRITDIEGDPESPLSQGCLCPKGAATFQLVTGSHRVRNVLYHRPHGTEWETVPLDWAMERIAARVKETRDAHFTETWRGKGQDGQEVEKRVNHCAAIASLGGATLDNEWNYAQLKLWRALGGIWLENQARL